MIRAHLQIKNIWNLIGSSVNIKRFINDSKNLGNLEEFFWLTDSFQSEDWKSKIFTQVDWNLQSSLLIINVELFNLYFSIRKISNYFLHLDLKHLYSDHWCKIRLKSISISTYRRLLSQHIGDWILTIRKEYYL